MCVSHQEVILPPWTLVASGDILVVTLVSRVVWQVNLSRDGSNRIRNCIHKGSFY